MKKNAAVITLPLYFLFVCFILSLTAILSISTPEILTSSIDQERPQALETMTRGDFLLLNANLEYMKTRDPLTDNIPVHIKARELEFANRTISKTGNTKNQAWDHRGPFNVGGRMRCIAIDIMDEDHMLAGSASGGMWQTLNTGGCGIR